MSTTLRQHAIFPIGDVAAWKRKLLYWAAAYDPVVYLDSNDYPQGAHTSWDCLVAVGALQTVTAPAGQAFTAWQGLHDRTRDWLFGFLTYDLKNEVERLSSMNFDGLGFPDLGFFQPEIVAGIRGQALELFVPAGSPVEPVRSAIGSAAAPSPVGRHGGVVLTPRLPKADYLQTVEAVREHIAAGDVYELNLCQEFYAENAEIDPLAVFERLDARARAPFSAYMQWGDRYVLCASPERFLRRKGPRLVSQPIKGTRRRGTTPVEDEALRAALYASEKDRAENVMIVDLVRNDLARTCRPGSVQVEELFGIHTFQTVHQMISTVTGELRPGVAGFEALRAAFPMGSMTGAPKVRAMELIERYERTRRGVFSGAVGYCTPDGDFDFNVVIRSILYNAASRYVSVQVGGAIVYDSVPEEEYEECMVKAGNMLGVLREGV